MNTGELRITTLNAQGLPISVEDNAGETANYSYDSEGDLLSIDDPQGNVTNYTYDSEGRRLSMADPDRGNWRYTYDPYGEMTEMVSPNEAAAGTKTTFSYDALGRMTQRSQPDQTDDWQYDGGTSGCLSWQGHVGPCIGKLTSETSYTSSGTPISQHTYTYGPAGPLVVSTTQVGTGATYSFTTTRTNGLLDTVQYPSGFEIKYGYDSIGELSIVSCIGGCTTSAPPLLWQLNTTNAAGQITQETDGNGVVTNNTYDPAVDTLTATQAGAGSTPTGVANFTYTYDNAGNLVQRQDLNENLTENFQYDNLYRLTTDSLTVGSTTTSVNLTYDMVGNITSKSDVGIYRYGGSYGGSGPATGPHQIASITCATGASCASLDNVNTNYTYDLDGNTLAGNGYTFTWTSYDLANTIKKGNTTFAYAYDADHNRVSQVRSISGGATTSTEFVNNSGYGQFSELQNNSTWIDYIVAGGKLIGLRITPPSSLGSSRCGLSSSGPCNLFFVTDHLGSVAVITNDSGTVLERDSYDPWGKRRYPNGVSDVNNTVKSRTTRGFIGQEMLQDGAGFELVNLNARMYDPVTGRFLSPDPQLPKGGDQVDLLNSYTYCDNNPLSLSDPTGQSFLAIFAAIVAIVVAVVFHIWLPGIETYLWGAGAYTTAGGWEVANAAIAGAVSGAASSAISSGGNLDATLMGLGIGAGTGAAFGGVGAATDGGSTSPFGKFLVTNGVKAAATDVDYAAQIAGDGLVGGLSSKAAGGSFESGFLAAGFSNAFGNNLLGHYLMQDGGNRLTFYNVAEQAITGGVGSVIGGGSFENGAITGSFRYLFNECASGKCWTTSAEHALAASGNYSGYYKLACADGDAYACQAGQIASGNGFWSWATTMRLRIEDDLWGSIGLNGTNMNSIRSALALGYANYLPDSQAQAIVPSASAIAEIHWQVFGAFGIPPSAFGGTPFAGDLPFAASNGTMFTHGIIMGGQGWCPNCGP